MWLKKIRSGKDKNYLFEISGSLSLTFFPKKIFLITFSKYLMLFITFNKINFKNCVFQ